MVYTWRLTMFILDQNFTRNLTGNEYECLSSIHPRRNLMHIISAIGWLLNDDSNNE